MVPGYARDSDILHGKDQQMKQYTVAAFMALALAGSLSQAQAKSFSDKAEADQVVGMSDSDPAMQKAFDKARKTLPDFLQKAANPAPGTQSYLLKVGLSDGSNTEYFWVGDFQRSGGQYQATLANTPALVRGYRNGQRITFQPAQIVDWMYMDTSKSRMRGNFTACALLSKETQKEADAFKKQYGLSCED